VINASKERVDNWHRGTTRHRTLWHYSCPRETNIKRQTAIKTRYNIRL